MKIILASNNKNKLREFSGIVKDAEIISQSQAGIKLEVEETGSTFEENAFLKANAVHKLSKCAVIADDSGLEVDALDGRPGIYSARYGGDISDAEKCLKILEEMKDVPDVKRTARFVCCICYISENGEKTVVRGTCEGKIGYEPIGENGFGYDPIFMYDGKSFAEIPAEQKNSVSHRSNALKKLSEVLNNR